MWKPAPAPVGMTGRWLVHGNAGLWDEFGRASVFGKIRFLPVVTSTFAEFIWKFWQWKLALTSCITETCLVIVNFYFLIEPSAYGKDGVCSLAGRSCLLGYRARTSRPWRLEPPCGLRASPLTVSFQHPCPPYSPL